MVKPRTPIPVDLSVEVLFASDRTCCVCRERGKSTQIHHLDEDPTNHVFDNLALVCLQCHDETQTRGGFGKHLTEPVVRRYRDEWLERVRYRRDTADQLAVSKMTTKPLKSGTAIAGTELKLNLYDYLDSLPKLRRELLDRAQPEWDSGVTAQMNQANYDYIDALQGVLVQLATYYDQSAFGDQKPQEFFSEIISSRFRWHRMHSEPSGPGTGGTIVGTSVGGAVMGDIEAMVVDMVMSLIGYGGEYSWKRWKTLWEGKAT